MKIKMSGLGPLEMRFFSWIQFKKGTKVKTGDLVEALKLSPQQEADLLYNLSRRGLLLKLWRGFYLVPDRLPVGGKWSPSPYLIIYQYMNEMRAKYQVSGPVVFNSYGYSTQLASEFVIYNNRVSKEIDIRQYKFIFVKVDEARLGSTKEFRPYGEQNTIFSSQPRMLLDAIADNKRFGTLPEAYGWVIEAIQKKKVTLKEMVDVVCKFGNITSKKRMGWILEKADPKNKELSRLIKAIPKANFLVPLMPDNFDGSINKKWGVIENFEIPT